MTSVLMVHVETPCSVEIFEYYQYKKTILVSYTYHTQNVKQGIQGQSWMPSKPPPKARN